MERSLASTLTKVGHVLAVVVRVVGEREAERTENGII